ncbi:MAG: cytochrome c oxidase assembly protein [Hyphomicrobiales bacterium]|nr:cytochrome c oxidase assembly protein [Hyphomicrobiales bacterium]
MAKIASDDRTAVKPARGSHRLVALALAGIVAGMLGLSYAAVPLYRIFCQVTGFGGTTQRADKAPDKIVDHEISVRFDASLAHSMPWRFRPVQQTLTLKLGESTLAFYEAENLSSKPILGTATFNVSPEAAGSYFSKIECFCFTEQRLEPGERVDMPVTFFVDPEILQDPDAREITEITLSYTFFPVADEADVASAARGTAD